MHIFHRFSAAQSCMELTPNLITYRTQVGTTGFLGVSTPAGPARGRARNNTRLHAFAESCTRFVSGKEAVRAVVRVARLGVWPGPQSAFGHWWRGAVRDPVWETEILAAVPPELPAQGNFRGLLFHGSAGWKPATPGSRGNELRVVRSQELQYRTGARLMHQSPARQRTGHRCEYS